MSIISPESRIYSVVSGEHKGKRCVVVGAGHDSTVNIIFVDNPIEERVTVKRGELSLLEFPGWRCDPIDIASTYNLTDYLIGHTGTGSNMLRMPTFSQPRALLVGDTLVIGEEITNYPRRGFNSSVLVLLNASGWVELAPRLPVALRGNKKFKMPIELVTGDMLITGCCIVKDSKSTITSWTNIYLDHEECIIDVPSCIPLALA